MNVSKEIESSVENLSTRRGFTFIDFAPVIRNAAKTQLLHGPKDWDHFNKAGYELLGYAMAQALASKSVN